MNNIGAIETVQEEIGPWLEKQHLNDEHSSDRHVLGIIEETGELSAALLQKTRQVQKLDSRATILLCMAGHLGILARLELKGQQGIRYIREESAKLEANSFSALTQLMHVFLAGYEDGSRAMLEDVWRGTDVSDGPSFPEAEGDIPTECADIVTYITGLANDENFHLGGALLTRWAKVSKRDWNKYPINGGENNEPIGI